MMEVAANGSVTAPKSYSLNMSNEIIPMYIFSETSEGKVVVDVTVFQKYDAKPRMNAAKPRINNACKYMDTSKISRPKIKKYTGMKHIGHKC